ncbi:MAG: T9SS type A sorting domain-containing protein [Flavobacteriales bacterium]|nr:T9SS type A sorting domain-containing protein [Flavobacteriales bacterium]
MNLPDGNGNWWFDYENPVQSNLNASYSYHPEILWGAATPGHTNDPYYFGIWKPSDTLNYYSHDSTNRLINYGNGCRIKITDTTSVSTAVAAIDSIINRIQNGDYPSNGYYQMSIFMSEYHFWDTLLTPPNTYAFNGDFLAKINAITDSINVRVNQNTMEWMNIEDIVSNWKISYSAAPFYVSCDKQHVLAIDENKITENTFAVYPNPAIDYVTISPQKAVHTYQLLLYDVTGKFIYSRNQVEGISTLSTKGYKKGLYLIKLLTKDGVYSTPIIIE